MESIKSGDNFLKLYGEVITPNNNPPARFGHTVNLVSKTTVVVFGGAISSPGNYTMTADLYLYNMATNSWKKLERKHTLKNI
jgi:N-acetylneuraminic acid mutarotase